MTFLVERNGRELSQIISDKTNKMNKLSATFTDASDGFDGFHLPFQLRRGIRCRTCERDIQYLGPKAEIIEERRAEQKQGQSEET